MPSTTYGDLVGDLHQLAIELYNRLGYLRDAAEGCEKDVFNFGRGVVGDLASRLDQLQSNLPADRSTMDLGGWTKHIITLGD